MYLLFFLICFVFECSSEVRTKYWKDYIYKDEMRSFYKFYAEHSSWTQANETCSKEGAFLFYPEDRKEAVMITNWWKQFTTEPSKDICLKFGPFMHIGISDVEEEGKYRTVDGKSVDAVFHTWARHEPSVYDYTQGGEEDCLLLTNQMNIGDIKCDGSNVYWSQLPFVCKQRLEPHIKLEWNLDCNMANLDYVYNEKTDSCYSLHLTPKKWLNAEATCTAEGSYLAVINSQQEADLLVNITAGTLMHEVTEDFMRGAIHLGFHDKNSTGWQTVKGVKLEESGYAAWGNRQPDGGDWEKCGSMYHTGHLNDISCNAKCFFICEHEVDRSQAAVPPQNFNTLFHC